MTRTTTGEDGFRGLRGVGRAGASLASRDRGCARSSARSPAACGSRACSARSPRRACPASRGSGRARSARSRRPARCSSIGAELALGLAVALDAEVRDPERLADRRLVRLAPLRLLERHGRLRGHALASDAAGPAGTVVGLAHINPRRYGKFSSTKSSGLVKSRVGPVLDGIARGSAGVDRALERVASSKGGRTAARTALDLPRDRAPNAHSGAPSGSCGVGSRACARPVRPRRRPRCWPRAGRASRRTATAPAAPLACERVGERGRRRPRE